MSSANSVRSSAWASIRERYHCESLEPEAVVEESSWLANAGLLSFDEILYGPQATNSLNDMLNDPVAQERVRREAQARKKKRHQFRKGVSSFMAWVVFLGLAVGGGYLVYEGITGSQVEESMPLPEEVYQDAEVSKEPVKLTNDVLTKEWPVVNADSDQGSNTWDINTNKYVINTMSIKRMAPGSVFIPKVGIYSEMRASDDFENSNYSGFQTLKIPNNTHRSVWYSAGAPLTASDIGSLTGERPKPEGRVVEQTPAPEQEEQNIAESETAPTTEQTPAPIQETEAVEPIVIPPTQEEIDAFQDTQGTTFIASHVSYSRKFRGAFYTMSTDVKKGELIWVKGYDGSLSTWRVNGMWFAEHQAFPQEYFSPEGPRRLVMTTCGGRTNRYGYYQQNVFTVAVPVPLVDAVNQLS